MLPLLPLKPQVSGQQAWLFHPFAGERAYVIGSNFMFWRFIQTYNIDPVNYIRVTSPDHFCGLHRANIIRLYEWNIGWSNHELDTLDFMIKAHHHNVVDLY